MDGFKTLAQPLETRADGVSIALYPYAGVAKTANHPRDMRPLARKPGRAGTMGAAKGEMLVPVRGFCCMYGALGTSKQSCDGTGAISPVYTS